MRESIVNPELLQRLAPFSWLSAEQRSTILPHVVRRKYPAYSVIQRAGERSDGLYVLICGRISLVHQGAAGDEVIAQTLAPGDAFGELGLLDGHACPALVRTDVHSEVGYVPRCVILRCLDENPAATVQLIRVVTHRLGEAHRRLAQIALTNVYERVAAALVANVGLDDGEHVVQIGSEQIARYVAASREMVTRVIGKMLREGLVRRPAHRRLVVVDLVRLRECAGRADPPR